MTETAWRSLMGGFSERRGTMNQLRRSSLFVFVILIGWVLGSVWSPAPAQAQKHRFAMILPGPIEDSDYNFKGYEVVLDVKQRYKIPASFSERISPPDAERVAREYIAAGHNIVAFHGGQYIRVIKKIAPKFPKVNFIMESSGKFLVPENVWNIGRRYPEALHAFGILAGMTTKSNKVSVIAGIPLPDFKGSINSIWDAMKEVNPKAELLYAFTGNQNDPVKARQTAEAQIASGVDFIINLVNLGVYGVIEAAKKSEKQVLITTYYTDKTDQAPNHFAGTLLIDFRLPYRVAMEGILKGQKGGYVSMRPGNGFELASMINVSIEAAKATEKRFDQVVRNEFKPRYEVKAVNLK